MRTALPYDRLPRNVDGHLGRRFPVNSGYDRARMGIAGFNDGVSLHCHGLDDARAQAWYGSPRPAHVHIAKRLRPRRPVGEIIDNEVSASSAFGVLERVVISLVPIKPRKTDTSDAAISEL